MKEESRELKDAKTTRRRAVRLLPEGRDLLTVALTHAWERDPGTGKFTREEKARLMGVSLATSIRILKGQGVDRPSLATAFKSLGLTWNDSYCELDCGAAETQCEPPTLPSSPPVPNGPQRRGLPWRISLIAVAVAAITPLLLSVRSGNPSWKETFNQQVAAAEEAYHAADFSQARAHAQSAIDLARLHDGAGHLAEASRLAGDMACASGDWTAAKEFYTEAITFRRSLGTTISLPSLREALGNVEIMLGQYEPARKSLMLSLDGFTAQNSKPGMAMACRGLGTLAHYEGKLDESEEWFRRSLKAIEGDQQPGILADVNARRALVLRDRGKLSAAKEILTTCLTYWTSENHPRWIARTQFQLATVELNLGESVKAKQLLSQSRGEFARLGDTAGVKECQDWLAKSDLNSSRSLVAGN